MTKQASSNLELNLHKIQAYLQTQNLKGTEVDALLDSISKLRWLEDSIWEDGVLVEAVRPFIDELDDIMWFWRLRGNS